MRSRTIVVLSLVLLLANLVLWVPSSLAKKSSAFDQLDLLVFLRHEIVEQYVEPPDQEKMIDAAAQAMVESLQDPYTSYLSPDDLKQFDKRIRGSFSGIGAEVTIKDNRIQVVSPLEESPAWRSGVMAGDIILEIDGVTTLGMNINDAVDRLTGPENTQVKIKVHHESGKEEEITITRAQINVATVKGIGRNADHHWNYIVDPELKIGYIRLTQFSSGTADELKVALAQLKKDGGKGLVLDLRFNPGGLLESAVAVSNMFLDKDKAIVSVKGRVVPETIYRSTEAGRVTDLPLVILANEWSASAAEIVTGALADNNRAQFIGTRTFGKGSVQQIRMLENGEGAIKITNAYYYLPSGRNIHHRPGNEVWGVDPGDGFYVPMNVEQVEKMNKIRRERDILRDKPGNAPEPMTAQFIETELSDPQLAAGLRALQGKLQTSNWPQVGQKDANGEIRRAFRRGNLVSQRDFYSKKAEEIAELIKRLDRGENIDAALKEGVPGPEIPPLDEAHPQDKPLPQPQPAPAP